jgi:CHAT domain-containing protein
MTCSYLLHILRPAGFAVPVAVFVTTGSVVSSAFLAFTLVAKYRPRRGWHLVIGGIFAAEIGVFSLAAVRAQFHVGPPAAAVAAVCAALPAGAFYVRVSTRRSREALAWSSRYPADRRAADGTYRASEQLLRSQRLTAAERRTVRLTRARAAIAGSDGDSGPDGLVLATEELSDLRTEMVGDPRADWTLLFGAANDLVGAICVRARKHGDVTGYVTALRLLAEVAPRMPPDFGAMAVVHSRRAGYHAVMHGRLMPGPEAGPHARAVIANFQAAIAAVTPATRIQLPGLHAGLGIWTANILEHPGDLEAGIGMCREAIRLAGRSPWARAEPRQALALLLIRRAWETAAQLPDDASPAKRTLAVVTVRRVLAEAERLLRQASRYGGFDSRSGNLALLARATAARSIIVGRRADHSGAARAWRAAVRAADGADPLDRVQLGQEWAAWAETTQHATWCARAYAYLMAAVPPAVAVRYLTGERDRLLAGLQHTAEEAGYWLARAGRFGDAAVALELGRAVSLSEVLGRERPGLPELLIKAGRPDLLERYREALLGYTATEAPLSEDLTPARQRAWARYDAVAREIATTTGIAVPGTPPSLAELAAAAREGPLVYLAGATDGGYAIIVPAKGPPVYRQLPTLTRSAVEEQVTLFLRAGPERVAAAARWLWEAGLGVLSRDLPAQSLVTIIPAGLLGLLPVHAAGGPTVPRQPAADWAYLADVVNLRYAHNARTLLLARDRADRFPPGALSLLAVAAPDAVPESPLPDTVREVAGAAGQWARADTILDGEAAAVRARLADHTVWHFACHCTMIPDSVLDSALLLAGAELSLRAILALPAAQRRLAVLSACRTHLTGTELPDEAMGLPAGLLQAGFAGVVASHWDVPDRSTALLMTRFHELWRGQGLAPAFALAEAQRWLRTAPATGRYRHPYFWAPFALTGQ